ncbi:DUF3168 domain-containing protein [Mesorhizobium sp. CAU 1732]|uniref:DUF3168 domain-containing protein n=1 Tax=Mesorhizobium sp. CAU 1732 TaxID=3140358 RepID=UPI00326014BB
MASAAIELQKAIYGRLSSDAALNAALGGEHVYDHAPAHVAFPYVTFGRTSIHDWSTGTEDGNEHVFTIHVWSKAQGKSETLELMDMVRARLHDAELTLSEHKLVNLREEFAEARFNEDIAVFHGIARFRAVTEPLD